MPIVAAILYHVLMVFALVLARDAMPPVLLLVLLPLLLAGSVSFVQAARLRTNRLRPA